MDESYLLYDGKIPGTLGDENEQSVEATTAAFNDAFQEIQAKLGTYSQLIEHEGLDSQTWETSWDFILGALPHSVVYLLEGVTK